MPKDMLTIRCRMWRTGTEIEQPDMCFARTLLRLDHYFFVWTMREFSTIQRHQTRKIVLNATSINQITLKLSVTEDGEEYVSIDLDFSGKYRQEFCIVKLSLLDFEGKIVHLKETFDYCFNGIRMENFFEKERLVDDRVSLLPNDVMSLRCEIQMEAEIVYSMIESYRYLHWKRCGNIETDEVLHFEQDENVATHEVLYFEQNENKLSLKEPMKDLLKEGTLSNVSLQTSTKLFPAHKCILSARSPVFEAIFTEDMKQGKIMSVDIQDVNANTLEELLSYIYSNTIRNLEWESAIDLFRAADKYELLNLKRICSNLMKFALSDESVCAVLGVADQFYDRKLREAAEEYLKYKGEKFFTSDAWKSFKVEKSTLALDVLERLHCNNCCSEKYSRV